MKLFIDKRKFFLGLILFFFATIGFFFVFRFIQLEDYVYYGDNSEFFDRFQTVSKLISNDSKYLFESVSKSIREDNYNFFPILPLELIGIFNHSRLAYILSIYFLYFVGSAFIFLFLIKYFSKNIFLDNNLVVGLLSLFFLSPVLLTPMLRGEPSVGGLIFIFLSIFIFFKIQDYSSNIYLKNNLFLSTALAILPIYRRWFVFYVISFLIIMLIDFLIVSIRLTKFKKVINLTINYLTVVASTTIFFVLLSGDLYKKFVDIAFGNQFTAFKFGSWYFTFYIIFARIGLFYLTVFILSIFILIKQKTNLRLLFFLLGLLISSSALFLRTQDFSDHHFYLIMPIILILSGLGIVSWRSKYKNIFIFLFILFNIYNFSFSMIFERNLKIPGNFILSQIDTHPLVRNDRNDLLKLFNYLGIIVNKGEGIYLLSSSCELSNPINNDVFRNYCRDYEFDKKYICDQVLQTHTVDLLSGFPYHFFDADYVITTDPVHYCVNSDNQRVIGYFFDFVKESSDYLKINRITHGDGFIDIYKRVNRVPDETIYKMSEYFKLIYPNSIFTKSKI